MRQTNIRMRIRLSFGVAAATCNLWRNSWSGNPPQTRWTDETVFNVYFSAGTDSSPRPFSTDFIIRYISYIYIYFFIYLFMFTFHSYLRNPSMFYVDSRKAGKHRANTNNKYYPAVAYRRYRYFDWRYRYRNPTKISQHRLSRHIF